MQNHGEARPNARLPGDAAWGGTHAGDNAVIKMSEHQGGKAKNGASLGTFIMDNLQAR